jgi:phage tail-like protein
MPRAVATTLGIRDLGKDQKSEPALKHLFIIDGPRLKGAFTKVTGIQETIEVLTQRDGQNPMQTRKMPGTFQGGEVKLERGVVFDYRDLVEWFALVKRCGAAVSGATGVRGIQRSIRSTVIIIAITCDNDGSIAKEARQIRLLDAWPRKYQLADLDAGASDVATENITIAFEELVIGEQYQVAEESVARRAGRSVGQAVVRGLNALGSAFSDLRNR